MYIAILILQYILIAVLFFGAFVVYRQVSMTKAVKVFLLMFVVFGVVYTVDSLTLISGVDGAQAVIRPLDYSYICTGVISQLFMHWVFYNLLFSMRRSTMIIGAMALPAVLLGVALMACDMAGLAAGDDKITSMSALWANIGKPTVVLRLLLLLVELGYSANILIVSRKIVPIYQRYIEQTESDQSRNMLWINELANLYLIITVVYITNAVVFNEFTNIGSSDKVRGCPHPTITSF